MREEREHFLGQNRGRETEGFPHGKELCGGNLELGTIHTNQGWGKPFSAFFTLTQEGKGDQHNSMPSVLDNSFQKQKQSATQKCEGDKEKVYSHERASVG